jgi:hypothetical protein
MKSPWRLWIERASPVWGVSERTQLSNQPYVCNVGDVFVLFLERRRVRSMRCPL